MKKVIITGGVCCNPFWLSALVGDIVEIDAKIADKLIAMGRAELVAQPKKIETPESKMPKKQTRTKGLPTDSEGAE